ncbi:MAG: glycosyltransferase family 2 protein [Candidatus Aenigmarchaeota archaeon]|nr:glycosyltransferase family 2 protein [Candidatus Aenigmarchaeota archaeon]MDI6722471.1 glycosyltransferase family 2 protein [Candidatus Aenigmarchaeota archaeon]
MKASVIIPVYNESKNILNVLKGIDRKYEIIVVDDGSDTEICPIVKGRAKCIRIEKNAGKGYACKKGIEKASSDNIVFIDGDSQLDPSQIPQFVSALRSADMAIGVRERRDLPLQRKLSNSFAVMMIFLLTKRKYKDVLCGFRAVKKDKFNMLGLKRNRYEFESEMIIKASKNRLRIAEIPVSVRYKRKGMGFKESMKVVAYQMKELMRNELHL